jgi:hypothetical protein
MVRVLGQGALKFGHDLIRAPFRLSTSICPIIPTLRVRHRFSVMNTDLDVLWKALGDIY